MLRIYNISIAIYGTNREIVKVVARRSRTRHPVHWENIFSSGEKSIPAFLFSRRRPIWSISCREPHIWILNSASFSLQSRLSLTMPGYRCGGSCTTSVRNSVNFTLCCLPKIPAQPPPKNLDPDSVIWPLKSHSSPGPAASVLCLLDQAPGRHLWVVGWRLITSNEPRPGQTSDTAQSVRRSGRVIKSQLK